ncbi:MAG TPA: addiction module antidote protein, HigA family [Desulfofustis sp.]|jgi:addiction module HigA family antidote|nr:HigA family addiction module antidote protein [Desulfofustis sp. PB-SRB1]HBH27504.1 addiction module antidote protein, HigA family [Desulfofustis sp.]
MAQKLIPVTPGDILLEEFLEPMGISQAQLARDVKVPPNRINQIINGKREISTDTALRLGKYFGIKPEFWLNLQMRYNMKLVREKTGRKIDREVKKYVPSNGQVNPYHA